MESWGLRKAMSLLTPGESRKGAKRSLVPAGAWEGLRRGQAVPGA